MPDNKIFQHPLQVCPKCQRVPARMVEMGRIHKTLPCEACQKQIEIEEQREIERKAQQKIIDASRFFRMSGVTDERMSDRWLFENLEVDRYFKDDLPFIEKMMGDDPYQQVLVWSSMDQKGGSGSQCGKTTFLLAAMRNYLKRYPKEMLFVSSNQWVDDLSDSNIGGELLQKLIRVPLLFIDDFMRNPKITAHQAQRLFTIFEKRSEERNRAGAPLMTWMTSNYNPRSLQVKDPSSGRTWVDEALIGRIQKMLSPARNGTIYRWQSTTNLERTRQGTLL